VHATACGGHGDAAGGSPRRGMRVRRVRCVNVRRQPGALPVVRVRRTVGPAAGASWPMRSSTRASSASASAISSCAGPQPVSPRLMCPVSRACASTSHKALIRQGSTATSFSRTPAPHTGAGSQPLAVTQSEHAVKEAHLRVQELSAADGRLVLFHQHLGALGRGRGAAAGAAAALGLRRLFLSRPTLPDLTCLSRRIYAMYFIIYASEGRPRAQHGAHSHAYLAGTAPMQAWPFLANHIGNALQKPRHKHILQPALASHAVTRFLLSSEAHESDPSCVPRTVCANTH